MKKILCIYILTVLSLSQSSAQDMKIQPGRYSAGHAHLMLSGNSVFELNIYSAVYYDYIGEYEVKDDTLKLKEGDRLFFKKLDSISPTNRDSIQIRIQLFGYEGNPCVNELISVECKYQGVSKSVKVSGRTNSEGISTLFLPRIRIKPNVTIYCAELSLDINQFNQYQDHHMSIKKSPPQIGEFKFKIVSTSEDSLILENIIPYNGVLRMLKISEL